MTILHLEVPLPSPTKNSRQVFVDAAGKPGSVPGAAGRKSKAVVKALALQAVAEILGRLKNLEPKLLGTDDDVSVEIIIDVPRQVAVVEVRRLGPKPSGRTGRGKDLDNMASTILDAMNKVAYGDDRQVADLHIRKIYG